MEHRTPSLFQKIFMPLQSITREMNFQTYLPMLTIPENYNTEISKFWELFEPDEAYN